LALTAAFDMSPPLRSVAHTVSAVHADTVRALLSAEMRERVAELAHHGARLAALTIDPSGDPTAFDRATSAMQMYRARTAIEEIDDALGRIDVGRYGTCQECDRPIPFDRLEATPTARFCAGCTTPERSPTGMHRREGFDR
jgi:RNA polymerase-binding transcription factor DksA